MKVSKLIAAKEAIFPLCQERVSPKLAYKLMKFVNAIEVEEKFYHKKMKEIVSMYGEKNAEGHYVMIDNGVKIVDGKLEECHEAIELLSQTDVDAPDITFTLEELEEVKLSAKDIFALADFLVDKESRN